MLKILVHDYAGHPFPLTLSKELSKNYKVYHIYYVNDYGPKANFSEYKSENLNIEGVAKEIKYNKSNFLTRFFKDIQYGRIVANKIQEIKPDIIISGQCPTFAQQEIIKASKKNNLKFIIWIQDFYSLAVHYILKNKFWNIFFFITFLFKFYEKKQINLSDHIIIISKEFFKKLDEWKIDHSKISYIPNWGNLDEIKNLEKKNIEFLSMNNLSTNKFKLLYTGTLALKHNPNLLLKIARKNLDIDIIIMATGSGFQKLKENVMLPNNIKLLSLQPFNKLNSILSSADVLLAMINEDASKFSVPSKILNYFCAGKPIILSAPKENLASDMLRESEAGKTFEPKNFDELNNFIQTLKKDKILRDKLSKNGRNYAEKNFNIENITLKFKNIFKDKL